MIQELIAVGFLVGDFVYHRWFDDTPPPPPAKNISIPRVEDGAPAPLLYGRCRVKSPFLAWTGTPGFLAATELDPRIYTMDSLFVIGIPFYQGDVRIATVWLGDVASQRDDSRLATCRLYDLVGDGNFEDQTPSSRHAAIIFIDQTGLTYGQNGTVELLNGAASQTLIDSGTDLATTRAGQMMTGQNGHGVAGLTGTVDPTVIPGYRNYVCAFLWGGTGSESPHWRLGPSPTLPRVGFEVESFPSITFVTGYTGDQHDTNPIDVLYDLLTSPLGKLGIPYAKVDTVSFAAAAATLQAEGHGFSRSWEEGRPAREYVGELMRQIDAVVFEDPVTNLIRVKLIRDDYDTATLPTISPANCVELQNFAFGGQSDAPNKVRINFADRLNNYLDGGANAHNEANAVGQNGQVNELVLSMPGICTSKLAQSVAARELAARSRPLMKGRAIVDRSFRNLVPGDAVKLTWPEYSISGLVFRVANADRGLLEDGKIALDLIQDYYYVWRNLPPVPVRPIGFPVIRPTIVR